MYADFFGKVKASSEIKKVELKTKTKEGQRSNSSSVKET
jgi:hypothetical protein